MKQKRVSFKVAKAIKEAGYPQPFRVDFYYLPNGELRFGRIVCHRVYAPTYLDVWLWLWREKKIEIELYNDGVGLTSQIRIQGRPQFFKSDVEEAIIAAIEYLVANDLIK